MAVERQSSTLPPAQPSYILRGHRSQIHSVQFVLQNSRLLTGDADGWVIYWKLETKRALAVWKAHDGAILGTGEWGRDKFITHGRDNSLRIWQIRPSDEASLSTTLPAEDASAEQPKPWLLHTLPVNTLNFCAFSMCYEHGQKDPNVLKRSSDDSILVATPATDDKKINIYQFPDEKWKYDVPKVSKTDTGMVMAVKLVHHTQSASVLVLAGYEGGIISVHQLPSGASPSIRPGQLVYLSQSHTQPILSLDLAPDGMTFFTSSADAVLAAHRIPELLSTSNVSKAFITEHGTADTNAGARGAASSKTTNASNGRASTALETSGDPSISAIGNAASSTHPESSSFPFTKRPIASTQPPSSGLSSLLSSATPIRKPSPPPPTPPPTTIQPPHKITNTKHSGQQSLRVRSDGRILVTGGWDSRIRIYSTKTLKEVAVLKWHKEGVYAVDFATVLEAGELVQDGEESTEAVKMETGLRKLQRQREEQMQLKHWVVAGAKDGKVSLWEVF